MFRRRAVTPKKMSRGRKTPWRPENLMLIKQLVIGFFSILLVTGLIYGIWQVTRLPAMTISTIEVVGGYTISHDEVRTKVTEAMQGEYLKLIPKTFAFLYPKGDILTEVSTIDKLKDPVVERVALDTLRVVIDEYIPHALWCEEREGGTCYFIDKGGTAFSVAPPLTGSAFLRYRTLGREPVRMTKLTDAEQLTQIAEVVVALEERFNFPVITVELDVVGDVFYILRGGSEIKVSKRLAVADTIRNLEAVLSADEFKDLAPGDFPYIDLRFGNKVFVSDEWPVVEVVPEETNEEFELIVTPTEWPLQDETLPESLSESEETEPDIIVPIIVDPEEATAPGDDTEESI